MIRRVLAIIAIVVTALLLESTVFSDLKLLGVRPELMYLVTIVIAILEGPREGMVVGFAGGMAQDFLLNQPKGITALTLTLLGYAAGLARQYIVSSSPLLPTILVAAGTAAGVAFYQIVAFLLGQLDEPLSYAIRVTLLTAVYGAILTPIVYPILRRVIEGSRPTRVVRF
ncbi:MAG TPA: rod shape-determining protein MreD [Actinomycetota bacterium]